ncbi:uncharacterized protein SPPG_03876 [Spizellomyces punctatus DAOM BR117]|uniref:Uncharacterized protein n=1 Tax=Spizellomyces punctatus (strain DAOM BR117) TaxID=645134 RepID=A0A0L0HI57_SPIPD|nr:uncharacterized protein SPPG_03876 [Spizellomyces punctatus DAOM BR117]KND00763.1 hypothetical protein SPPG_03876 [Spizellomyces punctatus DAOM BR117]|eukprot:XP_016608802.1 hypothetical protein SPPG_03876 [Spizellomyces punctatus DAOM BR117]
MLRTPWGQDEFEYPNQGKDERHTPVDSPSGNKTTGGRSQIVFGTYHEPIMSSYNSMTNTSHIGDGYAISNQADYLDRAASHRKRSLRDSYTDVFNVQAEEPSTSKQAGSRYRTDKNQSNVFGSSPPISAPVSRHYRLASDIFNLSGPGQPPFGAESNVDRLDETRALGRSGSGQGRASMMSHEEYTPSHPSAIKRNPSNSVLAPSSENYGPDALSKGRRHYPQQHHTSNIFHS